jgi:hypothetical protein
MIKYIIKPKHISQNRKTENYLSRHFQGLAIKIISWILQKGRTTVVLHNLKDKTFTNIIHRRTISGEILRRVPHRGLAESRELPYRNAPLLRPRLDSKMHEKYKHFRDTKECHASWD